MAGQWEHLFGPDWQIWWFGGWKLACHSSLQPGRCSCSLSSPLLCFSQYIWATAAHNVEFHSWSVNTLKQRGIGFLLRIYCTVADTAHYDCLSVCISLARSFLVLLYSAPLPLERWNSYSVPASDPPDGQTNVLTRDHPQATQKTNSHKGRSAYLIAQRFKDLLDEMRRWRRGGLIKKENSSLWWFV